jgi:predicted ATPase
VDNLKETNHKVRERPSAEWKKRPEIQQYVIIKPGLKGGPMHLKRIVLHPEKYPPEDVYPFNLDIFHQTDSLDFTTPITLIVGENGSGKTTLLRALSHRCGIHIWEDTERSRYRYNRYEEELQNFIELEWFQEPVPGTFFSSQTFHDFARFLDEWAKADPGILEYFGGSSLLTQSHGQSMLTFFAARYKIKGLYFMDEPETALSPRSQIKLLKVLRNASESGNAQFIIATHSPILLAYPGAVILNFNQAPVRPIQYEDTEYYQIYKDFLNHRESYLEEI